MEVSHPTAPLNTRIDVSEGVDGDAGGASTAVLGGNERRGEGVALALDLGLLGAGRLKLERTGGEPEAWLREALKGRSADGTA